MGLISCLRTNTIVAFGYHCTGSRIRLSSNHTVPLHRVPTKQKPLTYPCNYFRLLYTCIDKNFLSQRTQIHFLIAHRGFASATLTYLQNELINVYVKCGSFVDARKVFDKMTKRDGCSWNAMIAAYRKYGYSHEALTLFHLMKRTGVNPDEFTFASILPACAKMGALEQGMEIHRGIIKNGFSLDVVVESALVDMYAKCGSIQKARELFDKMSQRDAVSWNAMIAGYAKNGVLDEALRIFDEMPRRDVVSWTAMIVGYAENGVLDEALKFFKEMPRRNVVTWTAMISGYAHNGFVEKAMELFKQMQLDGVQPDQFTFASILPACAKIGALQQGMHIHQSIIESGFLPNVVVTSALVDMYAKCGNIHKARKLFDKMSKRDVVSWNAMIAGYAMHGFSKDAIELFELMKQCGTHPNHLSFVCVLYACSHAGSVAEGCKYLNDMDGFHCITPATGHYVCMVDLLGRAGFLGEALRFIIKMPIKIVVVVWMCLLSACKSHKNIGLGVFTATLLTELNPKTAAPYVLLSNIYAELGRWGDVQRLRRLIADRGIKKLPGCSWIEVHKIVHVFCAGGRSHPQTQEIHAKLEELSWKMKEAGYFLDSRNVLNDVVEEEKELFLRHHSEKLAIAFGLLNMSVETTIRVVKNLRVCVDCHTEIKFISRLVAREIVVRDANRFHHFKQGQCSCGDYWAHRWYLHDLRLVGYGIFPYALMDYFLLDTLSAALHVFAGMHRWKVVCCPSGRIRMNTKINFNYNHTMPSTTPLNFSLRALCREGCLQEALQIVVTIHCHPVGFSTHLQLLHTCIDKNTPLEGKQIHALITPRELAFHARTIVQNKLINMYAKCGSLVDARKVFDEMTERDGCSWNVMIAAYRKLGCPREALALFYQMQRTGVRPDTFTFSSVLPACAKIGALEQGMDIHRDIIESGFVSDVAVASALIDMYAKCGSIHKAREVFDNLPQRNVVSWNAMIAGYAQNGHLDEGLRIFNEMPERDVVSWNAMIAGYAQNGVLDAAVRLFKAMPQRDVISWNTMIAAYAQNGFLDEAVGIFKEMPQKNVVSWNTMIAGYVQNGVLDRALRLFKEMPRRDAVSWNTMIAAYMQAGVLDEALRLFKKMPRRDVISWNVMIAGYGQNGFLDKALGFFKEMPQRNVVSWNAMIAGYAQNGFVDKALETFKQMELEGVKPNPTTFISILPACAEMGALQHGMDIHQSIVNSGFLSNALVGSALVDMYAKCGSIQKAHKVFEKMSPRDVVSWNAMIAGYAMHGLCKDALELFELMKHSETNPDHVSFGCVLFACNHAGLVGEGCKYFNFMNDSYCIMPTIDHYVCMVDLLGRAGYLDEALKFIIKMPIKPVVVVWTSLLGACKSHKNIGIGIFMATLLFKLDPENATAYVLLSNIYAEIGWWGDIQKLRRSMKDQGIEKIPGYSWIEVHKVVYSFSVEDRSHPQT
ncbi:pentatricopeptide repeat-containing protein At2g22070 [Cryptomeria japonica]|uniref:pentatricopeptide repeat-containing protein At2g22070 n=1 Tax=Cryptomeria japonica TaxID=3369 RepID=UPI0027DA03D3|nr:pentatricopeptide repeat-containing protein At2g22070 [Cryptomeria japonica]